MTPKLLGQCADWNLKILVCAIIKRAVRDSLRGDDAALAWLATSGVIYLSLIGLGDVKKLSGRRYMNVRLLNDISSNYKLPGVDRRKHSDRGIREKF